MKYIVLALSLIIGYFLGSLSFAVIIGKLFYKRDVREVGSKSAGATNVLRTLGKKAAAMVTVGDMLKGIIAYVIAYPIGSIYGIGELCAVLAGSGAVFGHIYPVFFKFKGGKGVLSSLALSFMIDWRAAIITLAVAILIMALTKYVSLGSMLGCVFNSVIICFFAPYNYLKIFTIIFFTLVVIIKHKTNIVRLIKGEERKLGQKV
ncbi:MAG: glycerol-3-phosphate 1-O-acyltransferase PlsY [Ruminococcaceae bacterium]|nr:glycerol-3-phosphate 1-O-acyltransferase PlsY [Oscillospiraceae bacterium]